MNASLPPRLRLFYAVRLPAEASTQLAEAQRALRGNWRPVRPDQMHLTLAFLPHAESARLPELRELGRTAARSVPTFTARLRGTGYFPPEGSPRVWFAKVEGEGLTPLADALRNGLDSLGLPYETLPFKPHVTLARRKGPAPRLAHSTFDLSWEVRSISLVRSTLFKTGPVYEQVGHYNLWREPQPIQNQAETSTPDAPAQGGK